MSDSPTPHLSAQDQQSVSASRRVLYWLLRLSLMAVFMMPIISKLTNDPDAIALFTALGMEPYGRIAIGLSELLAVVLLLMPGTVGYGALLACAVLCGAFFAHATHLGFTGEMALLSALWASGISMAIALVVLYRRQIPLLRSLH